MSVIFKIIGIALVSSFLSIIVKKNHNEYSVAISVAAAILVLFLIADIVQAAMSNIKSIADQCNINMEYISVIIKIILIAYLSEYTKAVLCDAGESAIAKKVELTGKIIIFVLSYPILEALFKIILNIF